MRWSRPKTGVFRALWDRCDRHATRLDRQRAADSVVQAALPSPSNWQKIFSFQISERWCARSRRPISPYGSSTICQTRDIAALPRSCLLGRRLRVQARGVLLRQIRARPLARRGRMIAGLFKAPTKYAPHINLPAARARAADVLNNMSSRLPYRGQIYAALRIPRPRSIAAKTHPGLVSRLCL